MRPETDEESMELAGWLVVLATAAALAMVFA